MAWKRGAIQGECKREAVPAMTAVAISIPRSPATRPCRPIEEKSGFGECRASGRCIIQDQGQCTTLVACLGRSDVAAMLAGLEGQEIKDEGIE